LALDRPRDRGGGPGVADVAQPGKSVQAVEQICVTLVRAQCLDEQRPVSADRLIDVLWGDAPVANPVNALQAQIGQLRRTFGATAIVTSEVVGP
jgi:DNA-binding SARP family transcriptional activator